MTTPNGTSARHDTLRADAVYPLLFTPVYQDYIWGGRRIAERYGRDGTPSVCAESWEISSRPEGMSVVRNGPWAGRTLAELTGALGAALIGSVRPRHAPEGGFPLLIKIIDAAKRLSVQVHPNEANADAAGGEPKTEAWVVLDAAPGAQVYAGLRPGTDRQTFEQAIRDETLEARLNPLPVRPGQAVFIPGGRVHAICEGCLLLEIQQNSNTTYRVYDWGRVGHDGKPRPLHVDRALQTIAWDDTDAAAADPEPLETEGPNPRYRLADCPFFRIERLELRAPETESDPEQRARILFTAEGTLTIEGGGRTETLPPGTSCLVPAALRSCRLVPAPRADVIRTYIS
ncbi:MAG: class I mannose-6-phosphate isomerase [Lentisphaerae bacterium]|nr:class I mannose-6-phosphate isomerase [Lentisphaerota bacterium]